MTDQNEQLELSKLLQRGDYVAPLNSVIGFNSTGDIGAIISAGILYLRNTDEFEKGMGIDRYQDYRVKTPSDKGGYEIGIEPGSKPSNFTISTRLETKENPIRVAGMLDGVIQWLITKQPQRIMTLESLYDNRGVIMDFAMGTDETPSKFADCGLEGEFVTNIKVVKATKDYREIIVTISESFTLGNDFAEFKELHGELINHLALVHRIKYVSQVVEADQPPVDTWTVSNHFTFSSLEKTAVPKTVKAFLSKVKEQRAKEALDEYLGVIKTTHNFDKDTLMVIRGRRGNRVALIGASITKGLQIGDLFIDSGMVNELINDKPFPEIKKQFMALGIGNEINVNVSDFGITIHTSNTCIETFITECQFGKPGIYITISAN